MALSSLALKIQQIPHLKLNVQFDKGKLLNDWEIIKPHVREYNSPTDPDVYRRRIVTEHWGSVQICSRFGREDRDTIETHIGTGLDYKWTELGKKCEYFKEVANTLGGEFGRIAVMTMKPGGQTTWHSHVYRYRSVNEAFENATGQKLMNELIVHVPIISPPKFKFSVMHFRDWQFHDFAEPTKQYDQHYAAGEAWGFNSVHYHNVFNHDTETRVTLMLTLSLLNKKSRTLIEEAVNNYNGELMEPIELS